MKNPLKNIRGDIATPILTILGIVTIVAFLVVTFEKLGPAVAYIKANQVVRKYSLLMENEGGLSKENKTKMISELLKKSIMVEQANISAPESVEYGEDLTLALSFNYKTTELMVSGFQVSKTKKSIPIKISRSTVSRRYNKAPSN
jgi:hypothetical protein